MKKIWEAPVLETIGMNMTEQGQSNTGTDGFYRDSKGALLEGFGSGSTEDNIDGEVEGPFTPTTP
ncbi:MAG: hypothetical protein K6G81_02955 [Lachnospiraceae bacterium]|nr:hypothetical protein [Lachnospiraceae bacterium]